MTKRATCSRYCLEPMTIPRATVPLENASVAMPSARRGINEMVPPCARTFKLYAAARRRISSDDSVVLITAPAVLDKAGLRSTVG